jgi:preprotein translocase subunit SecD
MSDQRLDRSWRSAIRVIRIEMAGGLHGRLLRVLGIVTALASVAIGWHAPLGVQIVFEARPLGQHATTRRAFDRTMRIMRARAKRLGARRPRIRRSGTDRIVAILPGIRDAKRAAYQLSAPGRLSMIDWEPNVLDEHCNVDATRPNGGQRAIPGRSKAVKRATRCEGNVDTGVAVVRDEPGPQHEPDAPKPDLWWVIKDEPVLTGGPNIKSSAQTFDERTNSPIVTFDLTAHGQDLFHDVTRRIAHRGARNARPGVDADTGSHHFAIRLDDELISTPYVNYRKNPDGIDASKGVHISGGFTVQSARDLAALLDQPPLPLRLRVIAARSQAGPSHR